MKNYWLDKKKNDESKLLFEQGSAKPSDLVGWKAHEKINKKVKEMMEYIDKSIKKACSKLLFEDNKQERDEFYFKLKNSDYII